jgi:hypothetical protein
LTAGSSSKPRPPQRGIFKCIFFNLMHKAKKERLGFYWLSFGCVCLFSFLLILEPS